jgi:hypothetical protein
MSLGVCDKSQNKLEIALQRILMKNYNRCSVTGDRNVHHGLEAAVAPMAFKKMFRISLL